MATAASRLTRPTPERELASLCAKIFSSAARPSGVRVVSDGTTLACAMSAATGSEVSAFADVRTCFLDAGIDSFRLPCSGQVAFQPVRLESNILWRGQVQSHSDI